MSSRRPPPASLGLGTLPAEYPCKFPKTGAKDILDTSIPRLQAINWSSVSRTRIPPAAIATPVRGSRRGFPFEQGAGYLSAAGAVKVKAERQSGRRGPRLLPFGLRALRGSVLDCNTKHATSPILGEDPPGGIGGEADCANGANETAGFAEKATKTGTSLITVRSRRNSDPARRSERRRGGSQPD